MWNLNDISQEQCKEHLLMDGAFKIQPSDLHKCGWRAAWKSPTVLLLFCNGDTCMHVCVCVSVYIFTFFVQKKTWIILAVSFQSSFSSRGAAWETFSLEDVHFKTTKANEDREAEWKPFCEFNYSNCYQSFSINLLSNFSTDIMNKTPIDNLVFPCKCSWVLHTSVCQSNMLVQTFSWVSALEINIRKFNSILSIIFL